ncbi:RipA family octameric membrane protein, partial [Nodularia sp. NIES-3585]|uniref:RipA family octameric membrane protein n=1 Tax=Nodularia sp. NIES-3585 TaxID=1973477 RepID=UPI001C3C9BB5
MQDKQRDNEMQVESEQNTQSSVDTNSAKTHEDISLQESYGREFNTHLLEQYKLYVEMADRVSSRRVQIGSFYTSILSALLALLSITSNKDLFQGPQSFVLLTVAILGLCLCLAWT